ncbi:MAG: hypothetical protein IJ412_02065 [Oscillospiraceae bacterium]|nr:hypothetical protein [Oscillospiraceae bacterium]
MFNRKYIANHHLFGENRLPTRSLLLPAQEKGITWKNFPASDRIQLLNGMWKFSWLAEDTADAFFAPQWEDAGWDDLPVPSMWQFHGYGSCLYPNVRYCFPYDPPYIHRDNPVGLYRLHFCAHKPEGRAVLRFLGVDSAYFVWLNGEYVGFSKGSRIAAEFDVTDALREGENLLAVKVYTYCDGSYLENQDMLMASGIFRDVMLVYTGKNALWDYTLLPDPAGFTVKYSCTVGDVPAAVRFTLQDAQGKTAACAVGAMRATGEVYLPLENPVTWNAEYPYLYTLFIEVEENGAVIETHTKKAGIAHSCIDGHFLKMNGVPITLKGVNRHDNNPRRGRAVTMKQIEAELREIKENGLNAIRCSHYTNHPFFYELASELGIYVMDEGDCESHGAETTGDRGALNKDPDWFDAFFDRFSRMYYLNKNETCINIWSLGNENGAGGNDERCAAWLEQQDVKKPIRSDCDQEFCNFRQIGYMPMQSLLDAPTDKPVLNTEYAHAMGNSPGGLQDIWNWIYENEHACGGYVWEYKSHGFYTEGRKGRPRYLYGGDFPDHHHWSNFSLDGFHTSDGTPKPAWEELREALAPVHVRWEAAGICIRNTYDFKTLDGVMLHWSVNANGLPVRSGSLPLDGLAPHAWRSVSLPLETQGLNGIITADCEFYDGERKIAHKQKILAEIPLERQAPAAFVHTVEAFDTDVTVRGADFTAEIRNGVPAKLIKDGKVVLDAPMRLNCWRAPTDNDGIIGFSPRLAGEWADQLVHTMRFGCHRVEVDDAPDAVTVTACGKFLPESHQWGFDVSLTCRILAHGEMLLSFDLRPYGTIGPKLLPRVGVCFALPEDYTHCEWLGRGPGDSYADRKGAAPIGLYAADVEQMNFLYDVPQETGNHEDCRRLKVAGSGRALRFEGEFSFSLHDFTLEDLTAARHCDELEKSAEKYLYIDHRHRGLGSNSCGPQPEKEYELPNGAFAWAIRMIP